MRILDQIADFRWQLSSHTLNWVYILRLTSKCDLGLSPLCSYTTITIFSRLPSPHCMLLGSVYCCKNTNNHDQQLLHSLQLSSFISTRWHELSVLCWTWIRSCCSLSIMLSICLTSLIMNSVRQRSAAAQVWKLFPGCMYIRYNMFRI